MDVRFFVLLIWFGLSQIHIDSEATFLICGVLKSSLPYYFFLKSRQLHSSKFSQKIICKKRKTTEVLRLNEEVLTFFNLSRIKSIRSNRVFSACGDNVAGESVSEGRRHKINVKSQRESCVGIISYS